MPAIGLIRWVAAVTEMLSMPAPVIVPFAVEKRGTEARVVMHVDRDWTYPYSFYLNLRFTKGDEVDRKKVQQLAGNGSRKPDGTLVNAGVEIPVKLTVSSINARYAPVVFEDVFGRLGLESHGDSDYSKLIARVPLAKGDYVVRVTALRDIPELDGVPVDLDIHIRRPK